MDYSQLSQTLIDSLNAVLVVLVGVGIKYLITYTTSHVKNDDIRTSLITSEKMIESSVMSAINNLSKNAKEALADGTISKVELDNIKKSALTNFKKNIAPNVEKRLEAHINDVQGWVINEIESKLESANKVTNV